MEVGIRILGRILSDIERNVKVEGVRAVTTDLNVLPGGPKCLDGFDYCNINPLLISPHKYENPKVVMPKFLN